MSDEAQLLGVTAALASELKLDVLLDKIMSITTIVLEADRSTLFFYDASTHELWSKVAGRHLRNSDSRGGRDCRNGIHHR